MIPKTIHYCWFGGNQLPNSAKKCIDSWKRFCPEYEIIEWNENNYDVSKIPFMKQAYDAKKWAFVSDYARLDIVYNYGGIYLDTDVELIKPLDALLECECYFGMENDYMINSGLGFGAKKNSEILLKLMNCYIDRLFILNDGTFDDTTCPTIETNLLKSLGFTPSKNIQIFNHITIFPKEYLNPKDFYTGKVHIFDKTYSIHHYDATWQNEYNKFCISMRWKFSKFLPKKFAKYLAVILCKIKFIWGK